MTLDTLRADRVGCYGYPAAETPALDALATRGVLFEQAYTPAPMTLPAHATLLTDLLPPEHGAQVNGVHRLADDVPTLAQRLSEEGYRTGAFVAAFVLDSKFGLDRGFDRYDDDLEAAYEQETPEALCTYRSGELVVDSALAWLDGEDEEGANRPFFAWVHLYGAHFPWHPHDTDADPGAETGSYDGEVTFADAQLGRLMSWLRERGHLENTLVVAVSDHGEGLGDHHEIEHAYLLNTEVLHVPLIVAGPGVSASHRVPALVSLDDFQPTALAMLGLADENSSGRSLAPALRGESIESGESYAETELPWTSYRWAPQRSLTTEDWKYIRTPQAELYDRATDREEYANLAQTRKDVLSIGEAMPPVFQTDLSHAALSVGPSTSPTCEPNRQGLGIPPAARHRGGSTTRRRRTHASAVPPTGSDVGRRLSGSRPRCDARRSAPGAEARFRPRQPAGGSPRTVVFMGVPWDTCQAVDVPLRSAFFAVATALPRAPPLTDASPGVHP